MMKHMQAQFIYSSFNNYVLGSYNIQATVQILISKQQ